MQTVKHLGKLYNVVDWIEFSSTTHLIIQRGCDFEYINYLDGHYYQPPESLTLVNNKGESLSSIRKQLLLRYLVEFLDAREIDNIDEAREVVFAFKKYIKNSNIERFLYWPLLNDEEFEEDLVPILMDLEYNLEQVFNKVIVSPKQNDDVHDDVLDEYNFRTRRNK